MVNRISDTSMNTQYSTPLKKEDSVEVSMPVSFQAETPKNDDVSIEILPVEKAKKMAESMNKFLETTTTELRFEFHKELNEYYVTLVDSKTKEVVKEVPSKKLMDMYAAMRDFVGFFVDEKI